MAFSAPPSPIAVAAGRETAASRRPKLGERVAEAIQEDIAALGWPLGHNLGGEAALMKRYGVSRSTLREAVRQVERYGLAWMRRGVNGGLLVRAPARDAAVAALATYLELAGLGVAELFDAREAVEAQALRWAAQRRTPAQAQQLLQRLDELVRSTDAAAEAQAYMAWRHAVAECGNNQAQLPLMEALGVVTLDLLPWAGMPEAPEGFAGSVREGWRRQADAVVRGDAVAAESAVVSMLRDSVRVIAAHQQAGADGRPPRREPGHAGRHAIYAKLGHRMPQVICRDLAGRRQGERLGSEAELLQRYGTSRACFREAVRVLELHGLVHVHRGQTGGFLVGRADPGYTVRLATSFFRHTRPPHAQVYEAWRILMLAAAPRCAQQRDTAADALLQAQLQQLRLQGASRQAHREALTAIGEHCGNRALGLFSQVFMALTALYAEDAEPAPDSSATHEPLLLTLEAILAHDAAAAEQRMQATLLHVDRMKHTGEGR